MSVLKKQKQSAKISTAEAFYLIFRALPKKDRLAVARYIVEDEEILRIAKQIPNKMTLEAFAEDKYSLPVFHSIEELRNELLS